MIRSKDGAWHVLPNQLQQQVFLCQPCEQRPIPAAAKRSSKSATLAR